MAASGSGPKWLTSPPTCTFSRSSLNHEYLTTTASRNTGRVFC